MTGDLERRDRPDLSVVADAAREAGALVLEQFARPSFRAGFGAALLSTAVLARAGARAPLAILTSIMIGAAIEHLYEMAEDMHAAATGATGKI